MTGFGALSGAELSRALEARSDAELVALLQRRPDLATPPPSSLTALAARAASRPSVERAIGTLNRFELAVCEAVAVLAAAGAPVPGDDDGTPAGDAGGPAAVGRAMEAPADAVAAVLAELTALALVVDGRPVPALAEALGPHPAGLGPSLATLATTAVGARTDVTSPTTPDALASAMAEAPPAAHRMLEALTWGPPVGTLSRDRDHPGAQWLVERAILWPLSPTQLVLPLEVGLAARGGRTHRDVHPTPTTPQAPVRPAASVTAEGAAAAEEIVRLASLLVDTWSEEPPVALRSGGLGVRELRRAAALLDIEQSTAATVVELVGIAGLVAPFETGEESLWSPSQDAADWLDLPLEEQWVELAERWLRSARTPWLVGTRNDHGALRSALEPGLERAWAGRLRRQVLDTLATLDDGAAPSADTVHELLTWHAPRATPPAAAVGAVLAEAALLGVTGAGALTAAGRALLAGTGAAAALAASLPEPVDELFVQGDLTGVVPGRPEPALGALLERSAEVESRGSGLTVRFTPASVRHALDSGLTGGELHEALQLWSRTPLPQPLEYLIADTARRHGQVRVGAASSYVRVDDPAAAGELAAHPKLLAVGLRAIAPTVLVSTARPQELLEALRAAGSGAVLEGPSGLVVHAGRPAAGVGASARVGAAATRGAGMRPRALEAPVEVRRITEDELGTLVARLRAAEQRANTHPGPARTDPVHALAILRDAAAAGTAVELVMVGATGTAQRRRVRPLTVDAGRVRLRDLDRDADITVAVHRISAVGPA